MSKRNLFLVTGMDLPIIMTLLLSIESEDLSEDLIRKSIDEAKNQLLFVNDIYNQVTDEDDE